MDGASFKIEKSKLNEFYEICNQWCKETTYQLEYTKIKKIVFEHINSYISIQEDGKIKKKGH